MIRRYLPLLAASIFVASAGARPALAGAPQDLAAFEVRINHLCTYMGLGADTAPHASCVITLKYWTDTASAAGARLLTPEPPPPPLDSYTGRFGFFRSPPPEQRQRELTACAGLGIAPDSGLVQACASAMDAVLEHFNAVGGD